ncbi:MAG: DUF2442 domain-containing protein [Rhodobiaceae bacterium]|nr:DUF2442 domain-containing protein [Rhodobiaceae bacterium]
MSATDRAFDSRPMPRLRSVEAAGDLRIRVVWAEGPRAGTAETVDLAPLIHQFKTYKPLRKGRVFEAVSLADGGRTLEWADGEIDMAATSVERLAEEQMTGEDFRRFLERNKLTRHAAAAALGRSLRMIQEYVQMDGLLPRVVALACLAYEHRRNA